MSIKDINFLIGILLGVLPNLETRSDSNHLVMIISHLIADLNDQYRRKNNV